jgi:hypothetical protein
MDKRENPTPTTRRQTPAPPQMGGSFSAFRSGNRGKGEGPPRSRDGWPDDRGESFRGLRLHDREAGLPWGAGGPARACRARLPGARVEPIGGRRRANRRVLAQNAPKTRDKPCDRARGARGPSLSYPYFIIYLEGRKERRNDHIWCAFWLLWMFWVLRASRASGKGSCSSRSQARESVL